MSQCLQLWKSLSDIHMFLFIFFCALSLMCITFLSPPQIHHRQTSLGPFSTTDSPTVHPILCLNPYSFPPVLFNLLDHLTQLPYFHSLLLPMLLFIHPHPYSCNHLFNSNKRAEKRCLHLWNELNVLEKNGQYQLTVQKEV